MLQTTREVSKKKEKACRIDITVLLQGGNGVIRMLKPVGHCVVGRQLKHGQKQSRVCTTAQVLLWLHDRELLIM